MRSEDTIPVGFCQCGCGQRAPIAKQSKTRNGHVKGQPVRFIRGHCGHGPNAVHVLYKVDPATGCWVWQRKNHADGYGRITRDGVHWRAHRWYYTQAKGPIPEGMDLDHLCRNPACVNPDHLEPVSEAENVRRGNSAKLTAADVREIRLTGGRVPYPILAKRYGVSIGAICLAYNRVTWRDVE